MYIYIYIYTLNLLLLLPCVLVTLLGQYVTGFAKRGLIHASDFPTLMRYNSISGLAMRLDFTVSLV